MAVKVNIRKNFRDFSLKVDFEGSSAAIGLLGASGSGKSMTFAVLQGSKHRIKEGSSSMEKQCLILKKGSI